MKITFLLLLCTTFLHVFGQNFSPIPADLNLKRYTEMNAPINTTLNEATLSDNRLIRHGELSNQLRSLVSSTNVQIIDSIYMWDWDSFNQEWLIDYRIVDIIYGADFLPASYVGQYLDNGEWINERRYSNTYTSNELPLTEIEE